MERPAARKGNIHHSESIRRRKRTGRDPRAHCGCTCRHIAGQRKPQRKTKDNTAQVRTHSRHKDKHRNNASTHCERQCAPNPDTQRHSSITPHLGTQSMGQATRQVHKAQHRTKPHTAPQQRIRWQTSSGRSGQLRKAGTSFNTRLLCVTAQTHRRHVHSSFRYPERAQALCRKGGQKGNRERKWPTISYTHHKSASTHPAGQAHT